MFYSHTKSPPVGLSPKVGFYTLAYYDHNIEKGMKKRSLYNGLLCLIALQPNFSLLFDVNSRFGSSYWAFFCLCLDRRSKETEMEVRHTAKDLELKISSLQSRWSLFMRPPAERHRTPRVSVYLTSDVWNNVHKTRGFSQQECFIMMTW